MDIWALIFSVRPPPALRLRRLRRSFLPCRLGPRRTRSKRGRVGGSPSSIISLSPSGSFIPHRSLPHPALSKAKGSVDPQQSRVRKRRGATCWQIQRGGDPAYASDRRGGCQHSRLYETTKACLGYEPGTVYHPDLWAGRIQDGNDARIEQSSRPWLGNYWCRNPRDRRLSGRAPRPCIP